MKNIYEKIETARELPESGVSVDTSKGELKWEWKYGWVKNGVILNDAPPEFWYKEIPLQKEELTYKDFEATILGMISTTVVSSEIVKLADKLYQRHRNALTTAIYHTTKVCGEKALSKYKSDIENTNRLLGEVNKKLKDRLEITSSVLSSIIAYWHKTEVGKIKNQLQATHTHINETLSELLTKETPTQSIELTAEELAIKFHDVYEKVASEKGWETQTATKVLFCNLPVKNRETMLGTCKEILDWLNSNPKRIQSKRNLPSPPKSLEQCMDEVAQSNLLGYKDWNDMETTLGKTFHLVSRERRNKAIEMYDSQKPNGNSELLSALKDLRNHQNRILERWGETDDAGVKNKLWKDLHEAGDRAFSILSKYEK